MNSTIRLGRGIRPVVSAVAAQEWKEWVEIVVEILIIDQDGLGLDLSILARLSVRLRPEELGRTAASKR